MKARAIGTVVALVAIGSSMRAEAARATFPGAPGRIVSGPSSGAATTMKADGTDVRDIAAGARTAQWSPDGSRLLYDAAAPDLDDLSLSHVWTVNADGSRRRTLFDPRKVFHTPPDGDDEHFYRLDHAVEPSWAPDGRRLVFTRESEWQTHEGESGSSRRIYTISARGQGLRRLRAGWGPVWSPGGGSIAYVRGDGGFADTDIALMRPDGRDVRILKRFGTRGRVERYPSSLSFSPDGRRLAYIEHRDIWRSTENSIQDSRSYLRILDIKTRKVEAVPSSVNDTAVDVVWRPDGKRIAFLGTDRESPLRNASTSLYSLKPDGTDRRLMIPFLQATFVDWQPLPDASRRFARRRPAAPSP